MASNIFRIGRVGLYARTARVVGCTSATRLFSLVLWDRNIQTKVRNYTGYDFYDKPSRFLVERNDPGADSRIIYLRHPTTETEVNQVR